MKTGASSEHTSVLYAKRRVADVFRKKRNMKHPLSLVQLLPFGQLLCLLASFSTASSIDVSSRSTMLRVALPVSSYTSSYLPSAMLQRMIDNLLPQEVRDPDDIEPIQAGAPNKASTPANPVTPCTPIPGKTAIVIGQDFYSISNYTAAFTGHPSPVGYMGYTALKNDWGELTGLKHSIDYGGGVQWVDGLTKQYPTSSIQLGLWLKGQCEDVVVGILDHNIQRLAKYIKDHGKHHAFFLRIGYEFDSSENHYDAAYFRVAFKRIVNIFREVNTTNVAFVWHASGFPPRDHMHLSDWYPGARYVDWCGISLFQQPYTCSGGAAYCEVPSVEEVIAFCKKQSLPVMIAESTPYGGLVDEHTMIRNPEAHNGAGIVGDSWTRWFAPVLSMIERHDIRMWSYINCNWDLQEMWRTQHAKGERWGDTRIEAYSSIRRKWLEYVLHAPRFQMYTSLLSTAAPSASPTVSPSAATVAESDGPAAVDATTNESSSASTPSRRLQEEAASPSLAPAPVPTLTPTMAPSFYPTAPNYAPLGRLHADVCTPPRTQVLLEKHPDFSDDVYGDRVPTTENNHSHPMPPGGGSIPHHRRDFYTASEKVFLRNMLEIIVFFLEILEVFLAIAFFLAVLVLMMSCLYKYCTRSIDSYREQQQDAAAAAGGGSGDIGGGRSRLVWKKKGDGEGPPPQSYQAVRLQDDEDHEHGRSGIGMVAMATSSGRSDSSLSTPSSSSKRVDRKGYTIIE